MYGNVLVIHSESTEMVGTFHKMKISHKRRSYLIRLTIKKQYCFFQKSLFHSFLLSKLVVLLLLVSLNNKIASELSNNTTATSDKLSCTNYVDFGKSQERFGRLSWSKNNSNYLDIKLKVFKRENKNAKFRMRRNFTLGEADFNQFIRQRTQLVVAADNFLREQNMSPVLQSPLSKDREEQLKPVHKVIDVVDRPNRRICVTLLQYKLDNPETSYAQVRLFGRKKEEENYQLIVYVNYKFDDFFIFLTS